MAGRVRTKLAKMLAENMTAAGHTVRFDPERLSPAQGYWRSDSRADALS